MRPSTVVCTTGTSIAPRDSWQGDVDEYRRAIRTRLDGLEPGDFLKKASAETNGLARLFLGGADLAVDLLHTETDEGRVCAEEVARIVSDELGVAAKLHPIEGLQVTDVVRFRRVGMQHLFQTLDSIRRRDGSRELVLNVTGGFKSVVPYVTLFGLLHRCRIGYVFERADALVELPAVPVTFDYERLEQARDAFETLRDRGTMPLEAFFAAIPGLPHHERQWYECLLEEDDGHVTTSAFAQLLLGAIETGTAEVQLSASARKTLNAAAGSRKTRWLHLLDRVADPAWRQSHRHQYIGAELAIFKPGNTSERLGCIIRGDRVHVAELWNHDEYEREAGKSRIADYDLSTFETWERPREAEDIPASPLAFNQYMESRLDDALDQAGQAETAWEQAQLELERVQLELEQVRRELEQANQRALQEGERADRAETRNGELSSDLQTTKQELEEAQRSGGSGWFRRLLGL